MTEKEPKVLDKIKNIWKGGKIKKDNFLILILMGVLLLVIVWPTSGSENEKNTAEESKSQITDSKSGILNLAENNINMVPSESGEELSLEAYTTYLEQKLENVLSVMEGAGKVKVMITLSTSAEIMVEKDTPSKRSSMTEVDAEGGSRNTNDMDMGQETVLVSDENGNLVPFIKKTIQPTIEGVVVAVQGGENIKIIQNITEAIVALFDIDEHKIKIVKMISS